ncbi:hypothetical protein CXB51_017179 [Gossypium anomalum]|uniref:FAR1 domain-containing protein n=1 Tax=Gossypium anomalum TaxID=47600 RepID=A0A8J6CZB8_9ROSI|nr:hypothetical protein CXB51_017179 [Gossypium anomalum]
MPCSSLDSNLDLQSMGENASMEEPEAEPIQNSNGKEFVAVEGTSDEEPYVGKEFESEEAAKVFYDAYATRVGFIMRVDAFRRSMRDGKVVWRRLVCNKEGFRKLRPRRSENRKPRAITREGCKAMIVVKKEKTGKWVVTSLLEEFKVCKVSSTVYGSILESAKSLQNWVTLRSSEVGIEKSSFMEQERFFKALNDGVCKLPLIKWAEWDEKDVKIRELTAELQRERKRSAAIQEQLEMVLREMEEHSNHLSRNIDDIVQSVREIESNPVALFKRQ